MQRACADPTGVRRIAIVLDREVISSPAVQTDLCSGAGSATQITGQFSQESAGDLAILIKGGALPVPVEVIEQRTVGATLSNNYLTATIKSLIMPPRNEHSFEEWGVRNLGRTLYDLCFGIYSERVWGLPTSQISSKQAQRVAKLNLKNIILRTLGIKADPATYFTKYMYPRKGISVLFENMAAEVRGTGNCMHARVAGGAPRA